MDERRGHFSLARAAPGILSGSLWRQKRGCGRRGVCREESVSVATFAAHGSLDRVEGIVSSELMPLERPGDSRNAVFLKLSTLFFSKSLLCLICTLPTLLVLPSRQNSMEGA